MNHIPKQWDVKIQPAEIEGCWEVSIYYSLERQSIEMVNTYDCDDIYSVMPLNKFLSRLGITLDDCINALNMEKHDAG